MNDSRRAWFLVLVAALGYFVDIYDLLLFGIVRNPSLIELGVPKEQLLDDGVFLLNSQMGGLLLGGVLWGILGDKRGRLSVLFASIALYSVANLANGFVDDVGPVKALHIYAVLRFIAGVGLAGELGAGITIVSETIPKEMRSIATALVAGVGIAGAIFAAFVGDFTGWRAAYFVGGSLGLGLLLLRLGAVESGLFAKAKEVALSRGSFLMLLTKPSRLKRYVCVILVAVPIWYAVGILVTFSPEIGKAMGMTDVPVASRAILTCYAGLVFGDLGSGLLSHALKKRKLVLLLFVTLTVVAVVVYFVFGAISLTVFYACCAFVGFATGYWAVFITTAAEQFGTNLRATATTTAPNFVRGMVVPLTWTFKWLKPSLGVVEAAAVTGAVVFVLAGIALVFLEETFGKDLDFLED